MNIDHRQWHRIIGIAAFVFLILVAVTGIAIHYSSWGMSRVWVQRLYDLHTGAWLGGYGRMLYDIVALSLIGLSVTGLVLWYRARQAERKPVELREADLFGDEGIYSVIWEASLQNQHGAARFFTWSHQQGKRKLFEKLLVTGDLEIREGKVFLSDPVKELTLAHLRRHRLAERMLADWWGWDPDVLHDGAERVEPVLQEHVEGGLCRLLGHPRNCPHGSPIPEGACCTGQPVETVKSLAEAGTVGTAAFVFAKTQAVFDELTRGGLLPGQPFRFQEEEGRYVVHVQGQTMSFDPSQAGSILVTT